MNHGVDVEDIKCQYATVEGLSARQLVPESQSNESGGKEELHRNHQQRCWIFVQHVFILCTCRHGTSPEANKRQSSVYLVSAVR